MIRSVTIKVHQYESSGALLAFAENLGWAEPDWAKDYDYAYGDDFIEVADSLEKDAVDYIETKGYTIIWDDPNGE